MTVQLLREGVGLGRLNEQLLGKGWNGGSKEWADGVPTLRVQCFTEVDRYARRSTRVH